MTKTYEVNDFEPRLIRFRRAARGFTLIELLVVVAIIALLISILLPSLQGARKSAKATVCATNMSHVGKAVGIYLAENNATYPFSYVYANNGSGGYDLAEQDPSRPFGYVHWTWLLYNRGQTAKSAFECPEILNGGHPRTFPGPNSSAWEAGQVDGNGGTANSGSIEDKQAERVAITGNSAVFPRNKFVQQNGFQAEGEPGARKNKTVRESEINTAGRPLILATEFQKKLAVISRADSGAGNSLRSLSHRPVGAFRHASGGANEYVDTLGFYYKENPSLPDDPGVFDLLPQTEIENRTGLIEGPDREINAVGRHHPGGDRLGGTTNFLYIDASVQRKAIIQTMINREWGTKFYSVTGRNEVLDFLPPQP